MEFHFAKQKKRFLAKSSILSKVPFYPEKPSELLEKFHFPTFLEFGHFFSCFLWVFVQNLKITKFQISKFHIKFSVINQTLDTHPRQCCNRWCNTGLLSQDSLGALQTDPFDVTSCWVLGHLLFSCSWSTCRLPQPDCGLFIVDQSVATGSTVELSVGSNG